MKYALDTSVLVRILVNRPQPLASDVIDEVSRRIADGDTMVVPNLVLSEAYYAVQHHYGVDKETVLRSFRILSVNAGFEFSEEAKAVLSIEGLDHAKPGFVDRLICAEQQRVGVSVLSCEKGFRRMPNAEVIPSQNQ